MAIYGGKECHDIRFRRSYRLVGILRVAFSHRGNKTSSASATSAAASGGSDTGIPGKRAAARRRAQEPEDSPTAQLSNQENVLKWNLSRQRAVDIALQAEKLTGPNEQNLFWQSELDEFAAIVEESV